MRLAQKHELRKLLAPELKQSLQILTLPQQELKSLIDEELVNNPFLEESPEAATAMPLPVSYSRASRSARNAQSDEDLDPFAQLSTLPSLQDTLLSQLEVSAEDEETRSTGAEIIGNLDGNGFLKVPLSEIAARQRVSIAVVEKTLKLIQKFEPAGVGARTIEECLLIQCDALGEEDPLLRVIIAEHLNDVAQRKFSMIAKELQTSTEEVEARVKKIAALNPKPGQNYSSERAFHITPDIFIDEKDGELEIYINQEHLPVLNINEEYRAILKKNNLPPDQKEYMKTQLGNALELIRAIARRRGTLRKVLDVIAQIQKEALVSGLSNMKPLTLQEVADKIGMHESTVSRVVMNKYAETPQGIVAIKDFFTGGIQQENGQTVSSSQCKDLVKELIEAEDKTHPLSDEELAGILLKQNGIKLARRTVAKYREEQNIPSSTLRRTH
jgi:RNA polymerase sigma-54 factor